MYINFDKWEECEGFSCGSGTSNQEWIINKQTGQIALFKERKTNITTDNISEKIASDIAETIGVRCAKIDLAIRNNKYGVVSYLINSEKEIIIEGINYISRKFPYYDRNTLVDQETGKKYSLEMILESIEGLNLKADLFKIFIFDYMIGNSDRHHSNWAIIKKQNLLSICPVYDNASSLCAYTTDEQIKKLFNDKNWVEAQVNSKSKSIIRLEGRKVSHFDFVKYLKENYYKETSSFVKNIKDKLQEETIDYIINRYINVISDNKAMFLKEYLKRKRIILLGIYELI